jgi:cbb3-type cytochrome oxidase subunit 3
LTFFIFAGDMLVMLFMAVLVVWVFWRSSDKTMESAAQIPLQDERRDGCNDG